MKITPIFLIVLLVSCKKNRDLPLQESEVTSTLIPQQKPETCNFGIQVFNKNKRIPTSDTYTQRKKPKGNKSPLSIPNATILLDFDGELVTNTSWEIASATNFSLYPNSVLKIKQGVPLPQLKELLKAVPPTTPNHSQFSVMITRIRLSAFVAR